jgi:hypothetical protein
LSFYGIARKVAVLILQDVHDQLIAIVVDTHLCDVFPRIGWCDKLILGNSEPDPVAIARAVESWLNPKLFRQVNEIFCGLRQLWNEGHRDEMTKLSMDMEYEGINLLSFMPVAVTSSKTAMKAKQKRKSTTSTNTKGKSTSIKTSAAATMKVKLKSRAMKQKKQISTKSKRKSNQKSKTSNTSSSTNSTNTKRKSTSTTTINSNGTSTKMKRESITMRQKSILSYTQVAIKIQIV